MRHPVLNRSVVRVPKEISHRAATNIGSSAGNAQFLTTGYFHSDAKRKYLSYQLMRNILAAHALSLDFCTLLDGRRPDLLKWFLIVRCIRSTFDRVTAVLHRFGGLSLLLAALPPPPFPTSAFVIGAGVTRYRLSAFVLSFRAGRVCRFALLAYLASVFGRWFVTSMWSARTLLFLGAFGGVLLCVGLLAWIAFRKSEPTRAGPE